MPPYPKNPAVNNTSGRPNNHGTTKTLANGDLEYQNPLTGQFEPAVHLDLIRSQVLANCDRRGSYRYERRSGREDYNRTAFLYEDRDYSGKWDERPSLLFNIMSSHDQYSSSPTGYMKHNGRIVLDSYDHGIRDFPGQLAPCFSTELEGWAVEHNLRKNRHIKLYDIVARMPSTYTDSKGALQNKFPRILSINERRTKFRERAGLPAINSRRGSDNITNYIVQHLPEGATDIRSRGRDLTQAEIKEMKAPNKGTCSNNRRKAKRALEASQNGPGGDDGGEISSEEKDLFDDASKPQVSINKAQGNNLGRNDQVQRPWVPRLPADAFAVPSQVQPRSRIPIASSYLQTSKSSLLGNRIRGSQTDSPTLPEDTSKIGPVRKRGYDQTSLALEDSQDQPIRKRQRQEEVVAAEPSQSGRLLQRAKPNNQYRKLNIVRQASENGFSAGLIHGVFTSASGQNNHNQGQKRRLDEINDHTVQLLSPYPQKRRRTSIAELGIDKNLLENEGLKSRAPKRLRMRNQQSQQYRLLVSDTSDSGRGWVANEAQETTRRFGKQPQSSREQSEVTDDDIAALSQISPARLLSTQPNHEQEIDKILLDAIADGAFTVPSVSNGDGAFLDHEDEYPQASAHPKVDANSSMSNGVVAQTPPHVIRDSSMRKGNQRELNEPNQEENLGTEALDFANSFKPNGPFYYADESTYVDTDTSNLTVGLSVSYNQFGSDPALLSTSTESLNVNDAASGANQTQLNGTFNVSNYVHDDKILWEDPLPNGDKSLDFSQLQEDELNDLFKGSDPNVDREDGANGEPEIDEDTDADGEIDEEEADEVVAPPVVPGVGPSTSHSQDSVKEEKKAEEEDRRRFLELIGDRPANEPANNGLDFGDDAPIDLVDSETDQFAQLNSNQFTQANPHHHHHQPPRSRDPMANLFDPVTGEMNPDIELVNGVPEPSAVYMRRQMQDPTLNDYDFPGWPPMLTDFDWNASGNFDSATDRAFESNL